MYCVPICRGCDAVPHPQHHASVTNMSYQYKFLNVGGHGSLSALVRAAATVWILSNANCAEQLEQLQQVRQAIPTLWSL